MAPTKSAGKTPSQASTLRTWAQARGLAALVKSTPTLSNLPHGSLTNHARAFLSKHPKYKKLFPELPGKSARSLTNYPDPEPDKRNPAVREMIQAFLEYLRTKRLIKVENPKKPKRTTPKNPQKHPNDSNKPDLQTLIQIKELAAKTGGFNQLEEQIQLLKNLQTH